MSQSSVKAVRRDLRRAMGDHGVAAIAEVQQNIQILTASLTRAHDRLNSQAEKQQEYLLAVRDVVSLVNDDKADIAHFRAQSFYRRFVWLFTGR